MPTLLGRNPFHTRGSHDQRHSSVEPHPEHSKSSRSFLGFMSRTHSGESTRGDSPSHELKRSAGSMNELKRFFRPAMIHRKPSPSTMRRRSPDHHSHTQSAIPPTSESSLSLSNRTNIYHDDSLLAQKYGKLGKILGSGAGGSVRVLVRPSDGVTFAVKEFRPRKPNEQVKDYAKKCTAEFCIGSTLHHPNIVETLDIFNDSKQNKYFEVMEYCPIDFFAVVMSGKMSRGEINCCLRQLTEGVKYLHSMGLAHRDLKLDNCVMTHDGILKLIDFGSAVVFKYPFEANVAMAHGIVGSDPYLAPEVITSTKRYDPQAVDVWSIGIIYCCMMLKRFPWKAPRESDDNFRMYCLPDDTEHDYGKSAREHEALMKQKRREKMNLKKLQQLDAEAAKQQTSPDSKTACGHLGESDYNVEVASPLATAEPHTANDKLTEKGDPPEKEEEPRESCPHPVGSQSPARDDRSVTDKHFTDEKPQDVAPQSHIAAPQHVEKLPTPQKTFSRDSSRHRKVIHGPYRLLRLLPHASRPIMSKILTIDPEKRATLEDMLSDHWFANIPFCTMDSKKRVVRAPGHSHTIVKEDEAHLETYKV
ncbi:LAMI_0A04566g1_1 [Lachancea mirantina]|uniref:non-specific serine/threonine protein kinase n=1 Tax=Lachancea mirantina TaxID=1230905 RepID=A0A1G4IPL6_9SACH|nr:LAMI_0A04566g1_1 [Lachancea mirantina]